MRRFILMLCIVAMSASCNKETTTLPTTPTVPERVYAHFEQPDTRLYIDSEHKLHWHAGDAISYFALTNDNLRYTFDGATGDIEGSFSKDGAGTQNGATLERNYAIYPYAATTTLSANGTATYTFATTQEYAEASFGSNANVMMAATQSTEDNHISFKNCGGYIKVQLYGEDAVVSSIKLEGNHTEPLAGSATLRMSEAGLPVTTMNGTASSAILLNCGEGVTLSNNASAPTEFWFVVSPTIFTDGFTITVTDKDGKEFVQSTTKRVDIERNTIQPMSPVEVSFVESLSFTSIAGVWKLNEWQGSTPDFGVYMDIDTDGNITLWQRINSYNWTKYLSTATISGDVISGSYSDGYDWSASYTILLDGESMTWTNTSNSNDVSVYVRTTLPDNLADTRAMDNGDVERFL